MEHEQGQIKSYSLVVEGDGIKIERQIPEQLALQIISLVMGGSQPVLSVAKSFLPKPPTGIIPHSGGMKLSLREFMDSAGAKRNPEKIVAIGAYLIQEHGQDGFTRKDVKALFKNAGEPLPGNYTRDFNWAVSNGWLAANPSAPNEYFVTNTGFEAIKNSFSSEIRQTTKLPRRSKRRSKLKRNENAQ